MPKSHNGSKSLRRKEKAVSRPKGAIFKRTRRQIEDLLRQFLREAKKGS